jgi:hypothetical protein
MNSSRVERANVVLKKNGADIPGFSTEHGQGLALSQVAKNTLQEL